MARNPLKDVYWPLVLSVLGLLGIGMLFVYSAAVHDSGHYLARHFMWGGIGILVLFITPFLGYRTFLSMSYLLYVLTVILLLAVLLAGQTRMGAQRWITLGPLVIQPSEFAKFATVMALANYLGSNHSWEGQKRVIVGALAMVAVPCFLIFKQPDLGSTLLFIPMIVVLLFLWGIRYRVLVSAALIGSVALPFLWFLLKEYQKQRILVFLDPTKDPLGSGYTAIQSRIAVGSGGFLGKGYLQGTQSQLQFVPEHHTDFIFCVIGEEWGFLGAIVLLVLYGFLFRSAFLIMMQTTDMKAKLLIAGIMSIIFSQVFINIGMTYGLMPITGLTLPLVSYGGSSLVTITFALGLILSIHRERSIF